MTPEVRARAERVSVYAVATAHRLGWDSMQLIGIRVAAEIHGISQVDPQLLRLAANDEVGDAIVRLCRAFDARRYGVGEVTQLTDEQCIRWLQTEAPSEFGSDIVDALIGVQSVIQPIGT